MSDITVIEMQGQLVVDSRLIAQDLGIQHKNLYGNIRTHQTAIEYFGAIAFETREFKTSQGNASQEHFAYLNEEQATFVMTLSRNTEKVIKCKQNLVKAFSKAKGLILGKVHSCSELNRLQAELAKVEKCSKDNWDLFINQLKANQYLNEENARLAAENEQLKANASNLEAVKTYLDMINRTVNTAHALTLQTKAIANTSLTIV